MVTTNCLDDDLNMLTHWGRVTHICVGKLTIIGLDNGLSPGRRQAIIWTNAGILSIGPLGTNFNEISIGIQTFSFKKMHLKVSSAKWRPFCLGLNVLSPEQNGNMSFVNGNLKFKYLYFYSNFPEVWALLTEEMPALIHTNGLTLNRWEAFPWLLSCPIDMNT